METQGHGDTEIFSEFLNSFCKILFNDGNEIKIAKGRLTKIGEDFIFCMGDYNQKIISKKNIIKIEKL